MIGWLINITLLFFIVVMGSDKEAMKTTAGRNRFIALCYIQLLSIQLLKDITILPDEMTYKEYYENFSWDYFGSFEIGFRYFVSILTKISSNFYFFVFIYGIIQVSVHIFIIKKYSTNLLFTYVLWVLTSFFALFVIREYLAIALCMLSIPFIIKKRIIPFLILTLLATSFHTSAIVWVFTYFLYLVDLTKPWKVAILILAVGFFVFFGIDKIFSQSLMLIDKIQYYMTDEAEQYTWKTLAVSTSVVVLSTFCYGKNIKNLTESRKLFYLMAWVVVVLDLINVIGTTFSAIYRISPYYSISTAFVLPDAVLYLKKQYRYIVVPIIIVLFVWLLIAGINQQRGFRFVI